VAGVRCRAESIQQIEIGVTMKERRINLDKPAVGSRGAIVELIRRQLEHVPTHKLLELHKQLASDIVEEYKVKQLEVPMPTTRGFPDV